MTGPKSGEFPSLKTTRGVVWLVTAIVSGVVLVLAGYFHLDAKGSERVTAAVRLHEQLRMETAHSDVDSRFVTKRELYEIKMQIQKIHGKLDRLLERRKRRWSNK